MALSSQLGCEGSSRLGAGASRQPTASPPSPRAPRARARARAPARRRGSPPLPTFRLEVSKAIVRDIIPITKTRYEEREIPGLFAKLRRLGDPFCAMVWKRRRWNKKVAAGFVRRKRLAAYRCGGCRRAFITGCWNFFIMNDRRPDRGFRLVKHRYGSAAPFDCYSVSFMQPYMMHAQLGCRRLTLLDVDWRIMDGHLQWLRQVRTGRLKTLRHVQQAVRRLDLGWVAYGGAMAPRTQPELDWFCGTSKVKGQKQLCRTYLPAFVRRFRALREVRLQVMALHDAPFDTDPNRLTKVVFMSNALDVVYTRWWEFQRMMKRAKASLAVGQKMVLIHHIAGYNGFMIYELKRRRRGFKLRTVCRDRRLLRRRSRAKFIRFQSHAPGKNQSWIRIPAKEQTPEHAAFFKDHDPLEYYTHLDVLAKDRQKAPRCGTLLAILDRRAKRRKK